MFRIIAAVITLAGIGSLILAVRQASGSPIEQVIAPFTAIASVAAVGLGIGIDQLMNIQQRLDEIERERMEAHRTALQSRMLDWYGTPSHRL